MTFGIWTLLVIALLDAGALLDGPEATYLSRHRISNVTEQQERQARLEIGLPIHAYFYRRFAVRGCG